MTTDDEARLQSASVQSMLTLEQRAVPCVAPQPNNAPLQAAQQGACMDTVASAVSADYQQVT